MCVVIVFYCVDCDRYDPIPLRPSKVKKSMKQFPVVTVDSVICLFSDCARRRQIFSQGKSFGSRSSLDCCYPFCTQDTCRLNVVPRTCTGRWQHDPENIFPVQLVVKISGELALDRFSKKRGYLVYQDYDGQILKLEKNKKVS